MRVTSTLISILAFCLLSSVSVSGQYHYEETPELREAYSLVLELRLDSARHLLKRYRDNAPHNLLIEIVDSYVDFLRSFLDEDDSSFQVFGQAKKARLKRLENIEVASPWAFFSQAEIHLQYAIVRSKHGEYIKAGWDINRAYKLLIKCKKEYPEFILADKSLSVIHALVGSIKGFRKSLVKIFTALEGSVEEGIEEINSLATQSSDSSSLWHSEIIIIQSLLAKDVERDLEKSNELLSRLFDSKPHSPLLAFLKGSIENKMGKSKKALSTWNYNWAPDQHRFYYLDLVQGIGKLNQLNPDSKSYLEKYVKGHPGSHYQHEARQKLAWYSLLIDNDEAGYHHWMNKILQLPKPLLGEDEQAYYEAREGILPNTELLRARLLYDACQYIEAQEVLRPIDPANLTSQELIEYYYRWGRINHGLGLYREAIQSYAKTIHLGESDRRYYACNAALKAGEILVFEEHLPQAKYYFERCLDIDPKEYKKSLHQQARLRLEQIMGESMKILK